MKILFYDKIRSYILFFLDNKKCFTPTPTCGSGPDQICSDGKCYPGTISCSNLLVGNLTQLSNYSCMVSTDWNGVISSLQVFSNFTPSSSRILFFTGLVNQFLIYLFKSVSFRARQLRVRVR